MNRNESDEVFRSLSGIVCHFAPLFSWLPHEWEWISLYPLFSWLSFFAFLFLAGFSLLPSLQK